MKLTATQLRRIIKEEVQKVAGRKRLSEGHSRISADELAAWKSGDWGYVDEAVGGFMPGRDDKFRHPAKPPGMDRPECPGCNKMMSPKEKSKFEAQGGQGYPAMCEECAELEARP